MSRQFIYQANPARVIFGTGTLAQLGPEIEKLGASKAFIITTDFQADLGRQISAQLGNQAVGLFTDATMHTPVEVTEQALAKLEASGADCLVAVGGGSTIGLAKALALRTDIPQIAVATTYAGSEMTPILGQTENGLKTTQRTSKVLPETVIYDVELTLSLPLGMSVTSGINAMAHAVEALYAQDANPIISALAQEGIRHLFTSLPALVKEPSDQDARADALYAAWLCGTALGSVGMALHHKLCHTLGGSFNLPHAETHTVILPHATAFNAGAVAALDRLGQEIAGKPLGPAIFDLAMSCGAPTTLAKIGMAESDLDKAADLALANPYFNPRSFDRDQIRSLLEDAYHGNKPTR